MIAPNNREPRPTTLAWVAAAVGPDYRVTSCRRLAGGITSSVHAVGVTSGRDVRRLVVKRWVNEDTSESEALLDREADLLCRLEGTGLAVPRFIARSRPEETDGHPILVMTRVAGHVHLAPRDRSRWIGQMAATLTQIHALDIDAPSSPRWTASADVVAPGWSKRDQLWKRASVLMSEPAPERTSFIHGDYQHFNVLWSREVLTAVVDWTFGGLGHPDRDVGHCRLNLAVLFAPEWAQEFRCAYEAEAGRTVEPWWDVYEITRYSEHWPLTIPIQVANRVHVDLEGMNDRVERLLTTALP
ncbi:MAG: phosphotransferase family protein [Actinomycetota bacterium]